MQHGRTPGDPVRSCCIRHTFLSAERCSVHLLVAGLLLQHFVYQVCTAVTPVLFLLDLGFYLTSYSTQQFRAKQLNVSKQKNVFLCVCMCVSLLNQHCNTRFTAPACQDSLWPQSCHHLPIDPSEKERSY